MVNSELNKRLLKRANWLNPAIATTDSNEGLGSYVGTHVQQLGLMDPKSPTFAQYATKHNIPYESALKMQGMGQGLQDLSNDPAAVQALMDGNYQNIISSPSAQRIRGTMESAIALPSAQTAVGGTLPSWIPGVGGLPYPSLRFNNTEYVDDALTLANRTPALADRGGIANYIPFGGDRYVRAAPLVYDSNLRSTVARQATGQMLQGLGQSINKDSPLFKRMVSNIATTHLKNQIDHYAPRNSRMGQAFNSFGHVLLRLLSSMPGYESIMNWLANWKYGDKIKALPGMLQNMGKSMVTEQPVAAAPAKQLPPANNPPKAP